jgi:hypothetical protein
MIIENPVQSRDSHLFKREFFYNGVIFDTCVLLVFFLDKYTTLHPNKKYLLNKISVSVTESQIRCLNTIISNLKVSKIIITPHILSEFLNRIRSELKQDYQDIKRECLDDLKNFGEIPIEKNSLIAHNNFIEFGNDISLVLATEEQIKNFKYSCIMSFDGRFIENFFRQSNNRILAFNLDTLQNFY